nr:FxSxx-COOH system tetratricopeptide repeat protein [Geodermatophilus africanus]
MWPGRPDDDASKQHDQGPTELQRERRETQAFQLPARNPRFTGRNRELGQLRRRLTDPRAHTVQAIHGMAGVGKTELAVEYAYRYLHEYKLVGVLDAERGALIPVQFQTLAAELGRPDVAPQRAADVVYGLLAEKLPWLLIFDNAERPADVVGFLPTGSAAENGHVIVTTRRGGWASRGGTMSVDVFSRQESIALLTDRIPDMTARTSDRIGDVLGDLPLAVSQAAAYLDYSNTPPEAYLELISTKLDAMLELGLAHGAQHVVSTLWTVARNRLIDEQPTIQLLELCSVLAPEPIPLDLFIGRVALLKEPLRGTVSDPILWVNAVGRLADLSLIRREGSQIVEHRLTQSAVRAAMPLHVRNQNEQLALRLLTAHLPQDIESDPEVGTLWAQLLPHVLTVTQTGPSAETAADVGQLLQLAARYFRQLGNLTAALPLAERAVAIHQAQCGLDHPSVGDDLNTLARIVRDLGDAVGALPLATRALTIHIAAHGINHPWVANDLITLSQIHLTMGNHISALWLAYRASIIHEAMCGPEHPWVGNDLNILARILRESGNPREALETAERSLFIHEATYGRDHPYVGIDLTILAGIHHDLGHTTEALSMAERALTLDERTYGADHVWIVNDLTILAQLHRELGDARQAATLARRALDVLSSSGGPYDRQVASAKFLLQTLAACGQENA